MRDFFSPFAQPLLPINSCQSWQRLDDCAATEQLGFCARVLYDASSLAALDEQRGPRTDPAVRTRKTHLCIHRCARAATAQPLSRSATH